jgi:hypothetical protein
MNKLIKELKDAIENNSISYSDLTIFDDEIILIQLFASEQVTFNITAKNNYYYIERDYYSEETGNNINSEEIFDKLEDVINFID